MAVSLLFLISPCTFPFHNLNHSLPLPLNHKKKYMLENYKSFDLPHPLLLHSRFVVNKFLSKWIGAKWLYVMNSFFFLQKISSAR